jgi:uncharacterized RDD family membrane protein YckC
MKEQNKTIDFLEPEEMPAIETARERKEVFYDQLYGDTLFPSLLSRVKAVVIDFIVILMIFSIASVVIDKMGEVPTWIRVAIFVFCIYIYDPLLIALSGGTIGHHFLGIRVKKVNQPNKNISVPQASIRFITKFTLGWLSFLTVTGSPRKRAIHDMASGSIVLFKS